MSFTPIGINSSYSIDVTNMVQDMINLPKNKRYRFLLRMQDESRSAIYTGVTFWSSKSEDEEKRPKIEIKY